MDYSLIEFEPHSQRYTQNDLIRFYAFRKVQQNSALFTLLRERYLNYFSSLFENLSTSQDKESLLQLVRIEKNNLEAGVNYFNSLESSIEVKKKLANAVLKFGQKLSGMDKTRFIEVSLPLTKYLDEHSPINAPSIEYGLPASTIQKYLDSPENTRYQEDVAQTEI